MITDYDKKDLHAGMRYPKRTSLYVYMIVNIIEPMCANGTWGGAKGR